MLNRLAAVSGLCLLLAACGGGEDLAPPNGSYAAIPITATARVNWDRSPSVISPDAQPACSDFSVLGWLTADATTLSSLQFTRAGVYSGRQQIYEGSIIDSVPDPAGTGQLRVASQGCAPAGLTEGIPLSVVFWFRERSGTEQAIAAPTTHLTLFY